MKKVSTAAVRQIKNFSDGKLTIGLDLGDRWSWYCVLDEAGEVLLEQKVGTTPTQHMTGRRSSNKMGSCRSIQKG